MLREKLRNKKGFTLIEIIVVIVILAVLMAVAVPSVMSYMNEGQKAKYEAVARTVLINTQTEYANEVASDTGYVENTAKANVAKKNYGDGVKVTVTEIVLTAGESGSTAAEDKDVSKVVCTINMNNKDTGKTATITANKKVELS